MSLYAKVKKNFSLCPRRCGWEQNTAHYDQIISHRQRQKKATVMPWHVAPNAAT
jgi:hypothetical protein